jgi:hypothetical protein
MSEQTDRELLELAAKAAGLTVKWLNKSFYGPTMAVEVEPGNPLGFDPWNPLTDDGDALRLAVMIGSRHVLTLEVGAAGTCATFHNPPRGADEFLSYGARDPLAATRRAIVRAAAELGKAMP